MLRRPGMGPGGLPWGPKQAPAVERAARPWTPPPHVDACLPSGRRHRSASWRLPRPAGRGSASGSERLRDEPPAFAAPAVGAVPTGSRVCPVARREGEHTVRVLASNRVSSASLQKQLFVVRTPCQPPPVTSLGPRKVQVGVGAAGQAETALGAQLRERSAVQPGPRDGRGRGQGPEASGP